MNEEWDDEEDYPEEDWDAYSSEEDDWVTCPNCKAEVYHDAERCPECGDFIIDQTSSSSQKPLWVIIIAAVLIALFLIQGFSF